MKPTTVLVVDDETNIRLMLRTTLETEGYRVQQAVDGREALKAIEREVPDVMILDLSMPVLDGMGVLQELKNVRPEKKPRIIVLTAYGSISTAVKATRLGAMDFLEKPVSPDEVRESVAGVLMEPLSLPQVSDSGDPLAGGYAGVLNRVRHAMRLANYTDAETLLMKAADLAHKDAAYFNLLGILYEAQREHRLARKFYGKAIATDKRYEPAQTNMRRLYELQTFGRTQQPVSLGDEPDVWYAKLPETAAQT
ncbi:MAG TPA: response regulator [Humisphaera sp.]|nr:response regulator [Humisphaera sp.]